MNQPVDLVGTESHGADSSDQDTPSEVVIEPSETVCVVSNERVGAASSLQVTVEEHQSLACRGVGLTPMTGIDTPSSLTGDHQRVVIALTSETQESLVLRPGHPIAEVQFLNVDGRYGQAHQRAATTASKGNRTNTGDGLVVGVTGLPAAGKSAVAEILADSLGGEAHAMGDVVRNEAERRGLNSGPGLREVSIRLRETEDSGVIARRLVENFIDDPTACPQVIEGIRSPAEVETLREETPGRFVLFGVHASPETRVQRLRERDRADDEPSEKFLADRDAKEIEFGVREVLLMSDRIVMNDGTIADLNRAVEHAITRVLNQSR
jgi:dephospho-CoA kinase